MGRFDRRLFNWNTPSAHTTLEQHICTGTHLHVDATARTCILVVICPVDAHLAPSELILVIAIWYLEHAVQGEGRQTHEQAGNHVLYLPTIVLHSTRAWVATSLPAIPISYHVSCNSRPRVSPGEQPTHHIVAPRAASLGARLTLILVDCQGKNRGPLFVLARLPRSSRVRRAPKDQCKQPRLPRVTHWCHRA